MGGLTFFTSEVWFLETDCLGDSRGGGERALSSLRADLALLALAVSRGLSDAGRKCRLTLPGHRASLAVF